MRQILHDPEHCRVLAVEVEIYLDIDSAELADGLHVEVRGRAVGG